MTLHSQYSLRAMPARNPEGHKGTFGAVAVIGGCAAAGEPRMIGAPTLSALAALRVGAGLAKLVMPSPILNDGLVILASATGRPIPVDAANMIIPHEAAEVVDAAVRDCDCLVIGPGLGRGDGPRAATLRAVQQEDVPVVIDADSINALAETPDLYRDLHASAVLTPHPGEFKRLCEGLGLKNHLGLANSRESACEQLAQRLGAIVVLKGARTVVSNGVETWINDLSDACLATAGTGDVLSGTIAGLAAQFVAPAPAVPLPPAIAAKMPTDPGKPLSFFDAACLAVKAHGLAAALWRESHANAAGGMLAIELANLLPAAVERMGAG